MATKKTSSKSVFNNKKAGSQGEAYTIWASIDQAIVFHLVIMACRAGGTVQLGSTQNGSAATLRLYHGGEGQTLYAGTVEAMEDLCTYYAGEFEALID